MGKLNTREDVINDIIRMEKTRSSLRSEERTLKAKEKYLSQMPVIASDDLASNLGAVLPSYLVPTNVGKLHQILKPYFYEVTFEIGADPTYGPNFEQIESFQVGQESGFLLTTISRAYRSVGTAGLGAPLQFTLRDNQSTRQYNDEPIGIQHIGHKSEPTQFKVPKLFMPNASISVELTSWLEADQATVGDGYQEIAFGGYRVPVEDAQFVLDSILV